MADHTVVESAAGAEDGLVDQMFGLFPHGDGTEMNLPDVGDQLSWNDNPAAVQVEAVFAEQLENTSSNLGILS